MITYDVQLCFGVDNPDKNIVVKCRDTGVNFRVYLFISRPGKWDVAKEEYRIPKGATAVMKITKADGTYCHSDGDIESDDVFFAMPPEAFTAVGMAEAEVAIYDVDGRRVTSATFGIEVQKDSSADGTEESAPYVDILGRQIAQANEAASKAEKSASAAKNDADRTATAAAKVEAAAVHQPAINEETGTWWVWDFDRCEYVDTGVKAGGMAAAIIDVNELPTEDITRGVFYRVPEGKFVANGEPVDYIECVCVDELPEVGEPAVIENGLKFYLNMADGIVYGYIDEAFAQESGIAVGWCTLEALASAFNSEWGGVIEFIEDDPKDGALRLLLTYRVFTYNGGWREIPTAYEQLPLFDIGWDGDLTGRDVVDLTAIGAPEGYALVKVSDTVLTYDQFVGATVTFSEGTQLVFTEDDIDNTSFPGSLGHKEMAVVSVHSAEELEAAVGTTIPGNGTYMFYQPDGPYAVRITAPSKVKKIDKKFLPNDVATKDDLDGCATKDEVVLAPESAAVGQTIKVKAVDENGKPSEWESVDFPEGVKSWNELEDRPFGDSTVVFEQVATTSPFDASPTNGVIVTKVTADFQVTNGRTYKLEVKDAVGSTFVTHTVEAKVYQMMPGYLCYDLGAAGEPIYMSKGGSGSVWDIRINTYATLVGAQLRIYEAHETVTQLDEKYIPDSIARVEDVYSKAEIDAIMGSYINDIAAIVGGDA